MYCFARIARDQFDMSRPMRLSARWVGSRVRDFEPCM